MPKSPPIEPKAGEVWDVWFGATVGVEQSGIRPALVISNDWFNRLDNYLVWIVPVTGTDRNLRYHIKVKGREGGLSKSSVIMCEQIRAVDRQQLLKRRGAIGPETLDRVHSITSLIQTNDPSSGSTR